MDFYTKGIYASNMVLLQNAINCIYGVAPGESRIFMEFGGLVWSGQADSNGEWKIEFNPGPASQGRNLVLKCEASDGKTEVINFTNVAVGEVWLTSGQSNMQLQMERLKYTYPDEFTKPENQNIRMITIPVTYAFDGPKDSVSEPYWRAASSETLAGMSGTSYFFAKKISEELGIPVGIVNACQGGTPISAWMSGTSLKGIGDYEKRLEELQQANYVSDVQAREKQEQSDWYAKIENQDAGLAEHWEKRTALQAEEDGWGICEIPGESDLIENGGIVWMKKRVTLSSAQVSYLKEKGARIWMGTIRDADRVYINGTLIGQTFYVYPPRRYDIPDGILKEGANTITLRIQQNLHDRKMYFWPEKHYAIASRDAKVIPTAVRNVERVDGIYPLKTGEKSSFETDDTDDFSCGLYIPLNGEWFVCATSQIEDCPPVTFWEYEPGALYNAMLSPCFNYAVRGALWYQGESNDKTYRQYEELLCRMINLWREKFSYCPEKTMPFVIIQLPSWADDVLPDSYPLFSDWALIREAQAKACEKTGNIALSVAIDAGEWNDLHPEKKLTGGRRAAEQALRLVYGKKYPKVSRFYGCEQKMDSFGNAEVIVKIETDEKLEAFVVKDGRAVFEERIREVYGFGVLVKNLFGCESVIMCSAEIVQEGGNGELGLVRLLLPRLPLFSKIKEIRYLWANCPECVNLYSGGLPVMPGRILL